MMPDETRNARITETMLGVEDHGILTAFLYLDFGGTGQGFGGYALDCYDKSSKRRVGCAFGAEFIRQVLETLGCAKWERLVGMNCRAVGDWSSVKRIGHIIEDRWFDPCKTAADFGDKHDD